MQCHNLKLLTPIMVGTNESCAVQIIFVSRNSNSDLVDVPIQVWILASLSKLQLPKMVPAMME